MEDIIYPTIGAQQPIAIDVEQQMPFAQEMIILSKQEDIERRCRINYLEAQQARSKTKIAELEQEIIVKDARIKDLENRLFGKKSEKSNNPKSEACYTEPQLRRNRGQQPGSRGHGRTKRPSLPIVYEKPLEPKDEEKICPICGLPHVRNPALDESTDIIEIEVRAHTRRYPRPAYACNPSCNCNENSTIITAPPPPKLIPRGAYGVSFWVEIILSKYRYGQPTNRYLQDLNDLGLPVSEGTVTGGLQTLAPLFEPVLEALYIQQMKEKIFHNDETRWEVFVEVEGKIGSRWYLWVTRSESVIFYSIDPSRSAAVPGAHFAGLQNDQAIVICDRYSSYKKLARLANNIVLAFCWAHVRRDFIDAGRSFAELEDWALDWREQIGAVYHLNNLRLEHWNPQLLLNDQSEDFNQHHQTLQDTLQIIHEKANETVRLDSKIPEITKSAQTKQKKVCKSLLEHWQGLNIFVEEPEVPMDNNKAENAIRGPVTGRKNYYGSGSIWSAELAATLFSILQTLELCGINSRHWLMVYLSACAKKGGQPPQDIDSFIPWSMDEVRRAEMACPYPSQAPPLTAQIHINS